MVLISPCLPLFPVCCIPGPPWLSRDTLTFESVLYDCRLSGIRLRWKDTLTKPTILLNSWREEWPLKMSLMNTFVSRIWSVKQHCIKQFPSLALLSYELLDVMYLLGPAVTSSYVLRWRRMRLWWATSVPWCGSMFAGRAWCRSCSPTTLSSTTAAQQSSRCWPPWDWALFVSTR